MVRFAGVLRNSKNGRFVVSGLEYKDMSTPKIRYQVQESRNKKYLAIYVLWVACCPVPVFLRVASGKTH
jgi:hypothetical protein